MFYLFCLGAHELHGPFNAIGNAHFYAKAFSIHAYQVISDRVAQNQYISESLKLVPKEYR